MLKIVLGLLLQGIGLLVVVGFVVTLMDLRLGTSVWQNVFVLSVMVLVAATGVLLVVIGDPIRRWVGGLELLDADHPPRSGLLRVRAGGSR